MVNCYGDVGDEFFIMFVCVSDFVCVCVDGVCGESVNVFL